MRPVVPLIALLLAACGSDPSVEAVGLRSTAVDEPAPWQQLDAPPLSARSGAAIGWTGEEIVVRVAAKPPASIPQEQQTVSRSGEPAPIVVKGRHDPTVLPRLVPIAEAMLLLVLADHWLRQRTARM